MRPIIKRFLWLGGGLCAAGVLLCAVTFVLGGFNVMRVVTHERYVNLTETFSPHDLKTFRLDIENQRILLQPTAGPDVLVHYVQYDTDSYTVTQEDGVFSLVHRDESPWYASAVQGLFGSLARMNHKVVVEVPAAFAASLDIVTSNASIEAKSLPKLTAAVFRSSNGSLSLSELQIAELTASTTNASIHLDTVTGGRASVTSTNGSLSLRNLTLTGDLAARTSNASLTVDGLQAANTELYTKSGRLSLADAQIAGRIFGETTNASLHLQRAAAATAQLSTSNGSLSLSETSLTGAVTAGTTNGSVRLDRLSAPDIRLESSNGSIKGSIAGREDDFSIVTNTSNGSASPASVIRQQAEKKLHASTTNASIRLEFVS